MSLTIDEILRIRKDLLVKSDSYILALRSIFSVQQDCEIITFGPSDRKDIEQLLRSIEYLLQQQEQLFDLFGSAYQFGLINLKVAADQQGFDPIEKLRVMVNLLDNILLFLPDDWKYYFTEKYKRALYENEKLGQSDTMPASGKNSG